MRYSFYKPTNWVIWNSNSLEHLFFYKRQSFIENIQLSEFDLLEREKLCKDSHNDKYKSYLQKDKYNKK